MILQLRHEPIGGGESLFYQEIDSGRHVIGREPEEGLTLDIESVSREHAVFFEARGRWFFSDLGSTNGSWVNGNKVAPESIRLLRDGDVVQLANVALRVALGTERGAAERSEVPALFIFREGEFQLEFPFSGMSSKLALSDLRRTVQLSEYERLPDMSISLRNAGKLELVVAADNARILFNGVEWGGAAGAGRTLYDRDELDAGSVKVVVIDPGSAKIVKERQIRAALGSLPPVPGMPMPSANADPFGGLLGGGSVSPSVERTATLPRVSTQNEPSATMGSGSGLFSGHLSGSKSPSGTSMLIPGQMGVESAGQLGSNVNEEGYTDDAFQGSAQSEYGDELSPVSTRAAELGMRGSGTIGGGLAHSSLSGGLGTSGGMRGTGLGRGLEMGSVQRFGTNIPELEEEIVEEVAPAKSQIIIGIIAILLVVVVLAVIFSIFQ